MPPLDFRVLETRSLESRITLLHLAIWLTILGFAVARRTILVWLHCVKCKVWWRGDYCVGLYFRSWAWPLSSSDRNSECFSIPRDFGQFHTPSFVETVWHGWESLVWKNLTVLNLIEHLWDELERWLQARPSRPTSVIQYMSIHLSICIDRCIARCRYIYTYIDIYTCKSVNIYFLFQ